MIEHIEYFKTTDGMEFKNAEEAFTHELETNKDVMKFKLVGYDRHDDEPYWEIDREFGSLVALAENTWFETNYVYIENNDAFNFIVNLAYFTHDEIEPHCFNSNSFEGAGWYEICADYTMCYMKNTVTSWYETLARYYNDCPSTEDNIKSINECKEEIAELEDIMKNLNKFI